MGHPKIKEKSGLRPRLPKNIANIKQKVPKGNQRGAPGGPRVAQGCPGHQIRGGPEYPSSGYPGVDPGQRYPGPWGTQ